MAANCAVIVIKGGKQLAESATIKINGMAQVFEWAGQAVTCPPKSGSTDWQSLATFQFPDSVPASYDLLVEQLQRSVAAAPGKPTIKSQILPA